MRNRDWIDDLDDKINGFIEDNNLNHAQISAYLSVFLCRIMIIEEFSEACAQEALQKVFATFKKMRNEYGHE